MDWRLSCAAIAARLHLWQSAGPRSDPHRRRGDRPRGQRQAPRLFAEDYLFYGPGGDLTFKELSTHFASLRAAFSNLRIVREQIIVDDNFLEARNSFSCDFTDVFTYSPIGLWSTGEHLGSEVINAFRYHDDGRLA
jgi:hypothetical protein